MTGMILIFAFFFIIYFIAFLRQLKRKKENQSASSIEEFHRNYRDTLERHRNSTYANTSQNRYKQHITKYNNPEDYREKEPKNNNSTIR